MKSFLFTVTQTINAFKRPHAGTSRKIKSTELSIKKSEALARIGITFVLLFIVLYLFRFDNSNNSYSEIAGTILGAIGGYWLR